MSGAGSAGSSVAYYIRKFALEDGFDLNITVFERSEFVGGRSTTVNVFSSPLEPVELGASIFVKVNKNLVSAVKEFGLTTSAFARKTDEQTDQLGVWDGEEFVFRQADGGSWWDLAKLFWKYGLAPVRVQRLMKAAIEDFLKLYETPHFPFRSLTRVAQDLELVKVTSSTGRQYLEDNNGYGAFALEVVQASTRVNYGQNLELIQGLETMVCMAADGAMAVEGGNWQIFEGMLKSSGAKVMLDTSVNSIIKNEEGSYDILTSTQGSSALETSYDTVVLAAPYQFSSITLPETSHHPDKIPYVTLHVTLFTSPHRLSPSFFSLPKDATMPKTILTTLHPSDSPGSSKAGVGRAGFWSISHLRSIPRVRDSYSEKGPVEEYLYKVFSPHKLNSTYIHSLLGKAPASTAEKSSETDSKGGIANALTSEHISWSYEKVWQAYPYLYPRVTFEELELDRRLWYTSGIESFISTMETSSLMGMNIARLVVDDLIGVLPASDEEKAAEEEKEESAKIEL